MNINYNLYDILKLDIYKISIKYLVPTNINFISFLNFQILVYENRSPYNIFYYAIIIK